MKFGLKGIRYGFLHISEYTTSRQCDCGIEGYRSLTSTVTRMEFSSTCRSSRRRDSDVELWR